MRSYYIALLALLLPAVAIAQSSSTAPVSSPELTETQLGAAAGAARTLAAAAGATTVSDTITFSEHPIGTLINSQYRDTGVIFGGSGPQISGDFAAPSPPVLTGTPAFQGDISAYFVVPGTSDPTTVELVTWDIGYFDAVGSVRFEWFAASGQLLGQALNEGLGYRRYTLSGGQIASIRFSIFEDEPSGFGIDNIFFSVPEKPDLEREKGEVECARGNPVNTGVGNKYQTEEDYRGQGPYPLRVARTFNSIGGDWQFFREIQYDVARSEALVVQADGKGFTFTLDESNAWVSAPDVTGILEALYDGNGILTGWRHSTLDDQREEYDATGRLLSVTRRSGISHSYSYNGNGITVNHSLGGAVVYQLDGNGQITGFTDPDGYQFSYSYDSDGHLTGINYPLSGANRSYHYEDPSYPNALTGITDTNGDRYATWNYDSSGRAILSEHNNGADRVTFDYGFANDSNDPRTTVTGALGKQTTYHYAIINGVRKVIEVEGHASANCVAANRAYSYDANAFLASKTDWKGNTTEYVRNDKGQELTRIEASRTPQSRVIYTQWHSSFNLPIKITEPGRETTYTYDSNGNRLGKSVVDTTLP